MAETTQERISRWLKERHQEARPHIARAEQYSRDILQEVKADLESDSEKAKKARGGGAAAAVGTSMANGTFWIFAPVMAVWTWWSYHKRRAQRLKDQQDLATGARRQEGEDQNAPRV